IGVNEVKGMHIAGSAVGTVQLGSGVVTSDKIAGGAVGASELSNNSVASSNLKNGAVNAVKLAADAVSSKVAQIGANDIGSVGFFSCGQYNLSPGGLVAGSKLAWGGVGATSTANTSNTPPGTWKLLGYPKNSASAFTVLRRVS
ncbi:hypothetical protein SAMN05216224_105303, partial [Thioclava dalianensis]